MTKAERLGRVFMATNPQQAADTLEGFEQMANNAKYVESVWDDVNFVYAEDSEETKRDLFIGAMYQICEPLSFLDLDDKVAGKLPVGVRDEMKRCLGFEFAEMVNHYKDQISPKMNPENRGVERPFRNKVMVLVDRFRPLSINPSHSQHKIEF